MRPVSMHVRNSLTRVFLFSAAAALLSGCGTDGADKANEPQTLAATHDFEGAVTVGSEPSALATVVRPAFHVAPVITDEPDDTDVVEPSLSAKNAPRRQAISAQLAQLATKRLTRAVMDSVIDTGEVPEESLSDPSAEAATASATTATVYTPAQIRAAYAQPALPATTAAVTSTQAAQLGAGQTIYLIDAQHDPNAAAELATFSTKFGLPACPQVAISSAATLPLAPAAKTGCTFSVVYSNSTTGKMSATAPAYDPTWATEIALDVQWAHATAPYARLILIEAANDGLGSLIPAVQLANAMGPGIVSQSFATPEGAWSTSMDTIYQTANMSYVASAGDYGYQVNWPASSPNVLAVGGTSLTYSATTGIRTESAWSGTGAGVSQYFSTPTYQASGVPGASVPAKRAVTDVSFNADPYTGQFVAQISPGSAAPTWITVGGTSLSAPQWAGLLAVANAERALNEGSSVGLSQALLYNVANQASAYTQVFADVTHGSDGSCTSCYAEGGYDLPTGLGTPNVTNLLAALGVPPPPAPTIAAASVSGQSFSALTFTVAATAPGAVTYSLVSPPAGMTINATTGVVSWPAPTVGVHAVVVKALDPKTTEFGQGTITVTITAPAAPIVSTGSETGTAQSAINFTASVTNKNGVNWSLSGQPAGMVVSAAGVVSWASPVAGNYSVTVIATDKVTSEQGKGVYTVAIAALKPPTVTAASISGYSGTALAYALVTTSTNPITYALTGAPAGLVVSGTGNLTWAAPVAGTFPVTVTVTDTKTRLTAKAVLTVSIVKSGPTITATASVAGTKGVSFSSVVSVNDSTSGTVSLTATGLPTGMTAVTSGTSLSLKWATPVTGKYSITITAKDARGLSATSVVSVLIVA